MRKLVAIGVLSACEFATAASFTPIVATDPSATTLLRAVSADGTTAVGEGVDGAFRWRAASGVELLGGDPATTAHAISATGEIVVGGTGNPSMPYRWSATNGIELLADLEPGYGGTALGVSADGSVIVGEFGVLPRFDPADCGFSCGTVINGSTHAFRWEQGSGPSPLVDSATAPGSSAVEVSADGSVVAINTFDYLPFGCSRELIDACRPSRKQQDPFVSRGLMLEPLLDTLQTGDFLTSLSGDGSTLVGVGNNDAAFRWLSSSFYQPLVRRNPRASRVRRTIPRAAGQSGELIGGDFGIWQYGKTISLKNMLVNGLGLDVAGWRFDRFYDDFGPDTLVAPSVFGDAGITGISADGLTWVGTALDPGFVPRGFVVTLDSPFSAAAWNSLPPEIDQGLLTAVLPGARTLTPGDTVTVFASVINNSATPMQGCSVAKRGTLPVSLAYWRFDPATNQLQGGASEVFTIAPGATQTLLLALTADAAFSTEGLNLLYDCGNVTQPAALQPLLNTVALNVSQAPQPDVIASAITASTSGYVLLNEGRNGAFAVATSNLGVAGSNIQVLALDLQRDMQVTLCETDPLDGLCLAPAVEEILTVDYGAGAERTFAVFVSASATVRPEPARNRIVFAIVSGDDLNVVYGLTSVAVADARFVAANQQPSHRQQAARDAGNNHASR